MALAQEIVTPDKLARIRQLNDHLRTTFTGGRVVVTRGFSALSAEVKAVVLERVRAFSRFTKDNDPYEEHDCGTIVIAGETFLWKIDYYDRRMEYASDDPADPEKTTRVLTVMLGSDY